MDLPVITTMTGRTPEEVERTLLHPLPPSCYKEVEGVGIELTDIDDKARDVVMNCLFGPCGLGWSCEIVNTRGPTMAKTSTGKDQFTFTQDVHIRICWLVNGVPTWGEPIGGSGGHQNLKEPFAATGANTNAISAALKHMGWQRAVYEGRMNHKNAAQWYAAAGPHPFEREILLKHLK